MAGVDSNMVTEESIICEESLDPEPSVLVESIGDDVLTAGLSKDSHENARLAAAFWESVWPKLESNGWEKKVVAPTLHTAGSTILATKKDLDLETSKEGKDYFVRIKDVIEHINQQKKSTERINQQKKSAESTAADRYRSAKSKQEARRLRLPKKVEYGSPKVDLSWKDGGKRFPKKTSSVGDDYQATNIPVAGSFGEIDNPASDTYCELVWDPSKAQEKGIILEEGKDVISGVVHNIRESALLELARLDYDVDLFRTSVINSLKPTDGSDWSREQKDKFHAEIFRLRRDIRAVAKSTELPIKTCHAYFLGTYKSTCEYRLLKAVCLEEREGKAATVEHGPDACAVCGDGGSLLICDGCEGEFHMSCLRPPLKVVPEGQWLCDECVDRRVLEARYFLIRHSKLFEKVDVNQMNEKKRSFDQFQGVSKSAGDSNFVETEESGASGKVIYRPVAPFLETVREYSSKISKVLSKTGDD